MDNQASSALTLKEILLGNTDSLNQAQHKLRNMAPYDEYGRPNNMYQIPDLDFNLQVTSEFENIPQTTEQAVINPRAVPQKQAAMLFRPAKPKSQSNNTSTEVVSTISGRFIATIPNEGVPQIILRCNYQTPILAPSGTVYEVALEVAIENAAGEKMSGMRVEYNFNEDKTTLINGVAVTAPPTFDTQEMLTDGNGIAQNTVYLDAIDYNSGKTLFFDINAGTILKKISISKI